MKYMKILCNSDELKVYPELATTLFPFEMLDEKWAYNIHGQTLDRLNQRGGLGVEEIIMNVKKLDNIRGLNKHLCVNAVKQLIDHYNSEL